MSDNEFAENFGVLVHRKRVREQWSQRDVAKRAGLSVSFLSDVENGKRSISLINAMKLTKALELPLSNLLPREPGNTGMPFEEMPLLTKLNECATWLVMHDIISSKDRHSIHQKLMKKKAKGKE